PPVRGANTRNTLKREYDFSKAKRGAVVWLPKGKTRITIRLDNEILSWFRDRVERAGGGNYQTVINDVLRQHMQHREPLEKTLRRVIREELNRASWLWEGLDEKENDCSQPSTVSPQLPKSYAISGPFSSWLWF